MGSRLLLQEMSDKQRLLMGLRITLERLEHGLAMPFDAEAVAHTKRLIAEAEAMPEEDSGLKLACMLQERR